MSLTREDLNAEIERFPTKEYLHAELDRFPTKEFLRAELDRFATKEYLHSELERFPTKEYLRAELARFATKDDLFALHEEMAQGFADLRRYMEMLVDDMKSSNRLVVEILSARMDAADTRTSTGLAGHERRIGGLEMRVTVLERPRKRPSK
jgi:hypothetical protein